MGVRMLKTHLQFTSMTQYVSVPGYNHSLFVWKVWRHPDETVGVSYLLTAALPSSDRFPTEHIPDIRARDSIQ